MLTLRLMDEAAAQAIIAGRCPAGFCCAPDYPAEGDRVAAQMFLERCSAGVDPRPFGAFLICLRSDARQPAEGESDGLVIGGIGFHGGLDEHGAVEIGYGVVASAQGVGHATEALGQLISQARLLGVRSLTAETDPENAASQAVLAHHGFVNLGADERTLCFGLVLGER